MYKAYFVPEARQPRLGIPGKKKIQMTSEDGMHKSDRPHRLDFATFGIDAWPSMKMIVATAGLSSCPAVKTIKVTDKSQTNSF
jgi:hypothetical protein